jgi:hypothetical protein
MIVFPKGIRLVNSEDLPGIPNALELLDKVSVARIDSGYVVVPSDDAINQKYIEINVDSDYIWPLFCSLCKELISTEACLLLGSIEEETLFRGNYSSPIKLIELIKEFNFYLTNDCHIQFGFGTFSDADTLEIFITATKHFKVWTNKIDILERIMKEYGLPKADHLQFIDEFPRTTINLEYSEKFYGYEDLVEHLIRLTS